MQLNDLLRAEAIAPERVIVLRHRPSEARLNRVLPWLAAERPDLFNAYQQTQSAPLERAMTRVDHVAAFIGHEPGKALFAGLYAVEGSRPLARDAYDQHPALAELMALGMKGLTHDDPRSTILWFDLSLTDFYAAWKGRLVIGWPPPERSWWRRAHRNVMPVLAVRENSALDAAMPPWNELVLAWQDLAVLPTPWRGALAQWRGVYHIVDLTDGKAYGGDNLLGRWQGYAATGHGNNVLLRKRDPRNFRFAILERVSPDLDAEAVIRIENGWKARLHTRRPHGLNEN